VRSETGIVLVCHGSLNPQTKVEFDRTASELARAGGFAHVRAAYMELAEPSIPRALEDFITGGLRRLLVLPWFLNTGRHLAEDIPAIVDGVRRAHPGVEIRLLPHVGGHPGMLRLLLELVEEALRG
jgi:sirohydrochlorin cobaltochelatase